MFLWATPVVLQASWRIWFHFLLWKMGVVTPFPVGLSLNKMEVLKRHQGRVTAQHGRCVSAGGHGSVFD